LFLKILPIEGPNWIKGEGSVITRYRASLKAQKGAAGYILLWLLGVPIPVLFLIYALRGCT